MVLALVAAYFLCFAVLCLFGLHRAHLVIRALVHRAAMRGMSHTIELPPDELPFVTIQLPMYNEATVAARLIAATGEMDYPRDRFEIQVLDDSSDETCTIAEAAVSALQAEGVDVRYLRRPNRVGYKAGALDYGLRTAKGELVAIFDADFVPQPSFLRSVVGNFRDPRVAVVQTRWDHMNRGLNLLTSVQALMLDGHHLVENRVRSAAGFLWNFSGTGGVWRRRAIDDAGGWQHDTITEDLDLSYRAQLRGWRFVYRADVLTPSELPEDMSAFRAQQFRWAKGTVQTARKTIGRVLRSELTWPQKLEAFFHLTPHFAYPLIVGLTVLLLPTVTFMPASSLEDMVFVDLPITVATTGSLALFYGLANVAQGRSLWSALVRLPVLVALNAGLAPNQSRAVWSGLRSMAGEFVRTPKKGNLAGRYWQAAQLPWIEMVLSAVSLTTVVAAFQHGHFFAGPFAALFAAGYGYVAYLVIAEQSARRRAERVSIPVSPPAETVSTMRAA
ncbi:MAG: glycosyltransferase [Polyangiaceae bacterium]|nr:glycosyltransferase [Polyangiaceae bacterium]